MLLAIFFRLVFRCLPDRYCSLRKSANTLPCEALRSSWPLCVSAIVADSFHKTPAELFGRFPNVQSESHSARGLNGRVLNVYTVGMWRVGNCTYVYIFALFICAIIAVGVHLFPLRVPLTTSTHQNALSVSRRGRSIGSGRTCSALHRRTVISTGKCPLVFAEGSRDSPFDPADRRAVSGLRFTLICRDLLSGYRALRLSTLKKKQFSVRGTLFNARIAGST